MVHDALIRAMITKQIAASRGLPGAGGERCLGRRLKECLSTLAAVYGFANG